MVGIYSSAPFSFENRDEMSGVTVALLKRGCFPVSSRSDRRGTAQVTMRVSEKKSNSVPSAPCSAVEVDRADATFLLNARMEPSSFGI